MSASITTALGDLRRLVGKTRMQARRIWALTPPCARWALTGAGVLAVLAGAASITILALLGTLINEAHGLPGAAAAPAPWSTVGGHVGLLGLVILVREAGEALRKYLVQRTCARLRRDLTVAVTRCLHRADLMALAAEPAGARLGRIERGINALAGMLQAVFLDLLPALCLLTMALVYAFVMQPWIGLVLLGAPPTLLALSVWQAVRQKGLRAEVVRRRDQFDGMLVEQLGGLEYVRAADTHEHELARAAGVLEARCRSELRLQWLATVFGSGKIVAGWSFQFAVIGAGVVLSGLGRMPITEVPVYGNLFFSVYLPLWRLHAALERAQDWSPHLDHLLAALGEPVDRCFLEPAAPASPRLPLRTEAGADDGRETGTDREAASANHQCFRHHQSTGAVDMGDRLALAQQVLAIFMAWDGYRRFRQVIEEFPDLQVYLAGGTVRNILLGRSATPRDFDVFLDGPSLAAALEQFRRTGHMATGVYGNSHWSPTADDPVHCDLISIPRFDGGFGASRSIVDVLGRFDFTGNAVAVELRHGRVLDPQGGIRDMRRRLLRAVRLDAVDEPIVPGHVLSRPVCLWYRLLHYAALLGLDIEPTTLRWLRDRASYRFYREVFARQFRAPHPDAFAPLGPALAAAPA